MAEFSPGDRVTDTEDTQGIAIVVNTPDKTAAEWDVPGRGTLASDNPDYPADDPVIVVMWRQDLRSYYPYFTGSRPLSLSKLNEEGAPFYAFPASRLLQHESHAPASIPLDCLNPSPYHARNFDVSENRTFIERTAERGYLPYPPLVRVIDGHADPPQFEIINGHKRIWVAHLADFRVAHCWCIHVSAEEAAREWAKRHLANYPTPAYNVACARLRERLGDVGEEIIETYGKDAADGSDQDQDQDGSDATPNGEADRTLVPY